MDAEFNQLGNVPLMTNTRPTLFQSLVSAGKAVWQAFFRAGGGGKEKTILKQSWVNVSCLLGSQLTADVSDRPLVVI